MNKKPHRKCVQFCKVHFDCTGKNKHIERVKKKERAKQIDEFKKKWVIRIEK